MSLTHTRAHKHTKHTQTHTKHLVHS